MSIDFAQTQKNQLDLLIDSQKKLLCKCVISEYKELFNFSIEEIQCEGALQLKNKVKFYGAGVKKNLINIITLKSSLRIFKIKSALLRYREKNIKALSKVNRQTSEINETSRVLYVFGNPYSKFSTRIKNHLGVDNVGVYFFTLLIGYAKSLILEEHSVYLSLISRYTNTITLILKKN